LRAQRILLEPTSSSADVETQRPNHFPGATLMDRITKSLLDEFSRDHGLGRLQEDDRFEHFATYVTVHRQHSETFDTSEIVLGDKSMGIDAVATIVNGNLITDTDSFDELADNASYLDVTFIFVQADRGQSFEAAKIGTFGYSILDFFNEDSELPRSKEIKEAAKLMMAIYDKSSKFKRGKPACRLYYVTTGKWTGDQILEARRLSVKDDLTALGVFRDVSFTPVGADTLQTLYNETKNSIHREFLFPNRTPIPEVRGVKEAYLGFVAAPTFLKIIEDEDGDSFALYKLEYMVRNQRLDRGYRNARFQMLLAARLLYDSGQLPRMNSRDMEKYCSGLNAILWNAKRSEDLFEDAAKAVYKAAEGNLERDNIHTQPFTEKLIEQIRGIKGRKAKPKKKAKK
jgi:hypothetical protein